MPIGEIFIFESFILGKAMYFAWVFQVDVIELATLA